VEPLRRPGLPGLPKRQSASILTHGFVPIASSSRPFFSSQLGHELVSIKVYRPRDQLCRSRFFSCGISHRVSSSTNCDERRLVALRQLLHREESCSSSRPAYSHYNTKYAAAEVSCESQRRDCCCCAAAAAAGTWPKDYF
jgi:predicted ATP-grasp superfamily ATP-dependent carboligase